MLIVKAKLITAAKITGDGLTDRVKAAGPGGDSCENHSVKPHWPSGNTADNS